MFCTYIFPHFRNKFCLLFQGTAHCLFMNNVILWEEQKVKQQKNPISEILKCTLFCSRHFLNVFLEENRILLIFLMDHFKCNVYGIETLAVQNRWFHTLGFLWGVEHFHLLRNKNDATGSSRNRTLTERHPWGSQKRLMGNSRY